MSFFNASHLTICFSVQFSLSAAAVTYSNRYMKLHENCLLMSPYWPETFALTSFLFPISACLKLLLQLQSLPEPLIPATFWWRVLQVLPHFFSAFLQVKVRILIPPLFPGKCLNIPEWHHGHHHQFLATRTDGFIFASLASVMGGWAQSWTPEWHGACTPCLPAEALALLFLVGSDGISGSSPSHSTSEVTIKYLNSR